MSQKYNVAVAIWDATSKKGTNYYSVQLTEVKEDAVSNSVFASVCAIYVFANVVVAVFVLYMVVTS